MLLQLRSKYKNLYPGQWDVSAAGHSRAGESLTAAAIRETSKEIGIKIAKKDLVFTGIIHKQRLPCPHRIDNEFAYVYFYKTTAKLQDFRLCDGEVEKVRFASLTQLQQELQNNPEHFINSQGKYWKKVIKKFREIFAD